MLTPSDFGRAVSALPLGRVAVELHVREDVAAEAVRTLGLFAMRLGYNRELHISPVAVPRMREVLGARAGRRIA